MADPVAPASRSGGAARIRSRDGIWPPTRGRPSPLPAVTPSDHPQTRTSVSTPTPAEPTRYPTGPQKGDITSSPAARPRGYPGPQELRGSAGPAELPGQQDIPAQQDYHRPEGYRRPAGDYTSQQGYTAKQGYAAGQKSYRSDRATRASRLPGTTGQPGATRFAAGIQGRRATRGSSSTPRRRDTRPVSAPGGPAQGWRGGQSGRPVAPGKPAFPGSGTRRAGPTRPSRKRPKGIIRSGRRPPSGVVVALVRTLGGGTSRARTTPARTRAASAQSHSGIPSATPTVGRTELAKLKAAVTSA